MELPNGIHQQMSFTREGGRDRRGAAGADGSSAGSAGAGGADGGRGCENDEDDPLQDQNSLRFVPVEAPPIAQENEACPPPPPPPPPSPPPPAAAAAAAPDPEPRLSDTEFYELVQDYLGHSNQVSQEGLNHLRQDILLGHSNQVSPEVLHHLRKVLNMPLEPPDEVVTKFRKKISPSLIPKAREILDKVDKRARDDFKKMVWKRKKV